MIIFPAVGLEAGRAILEPLGGICKIAAAVFAQAVQGTVAEHATEGFRVRLFMAGEIFAFFMLIKIVVGHFVSSSPQLSLLSSQRMQSNGNDISKI